jgi:hypothetical protein
MTYPSKRYYDNYDLLEETTKPLWEADDWKNRLDAFKYRTLLACLKYVPQSAFRQIIADAKQRDEEGESKRLAEKQQKQSAGAA